MPPSALSKSLEIVSENYVPMSLFVFSKFFVEKFEWFDPNLIKKQHQKDLLLSKGLINIYFFKCLQDVKLVYLHREVLRVAANARGDLLANEDKDVCRSCRYTGYRNYIYQKYGSTGKGNRKVIPSCVVWAIRDRYPDPNRVYVGFKDGRTEINN